MELAPRILKAKSGLTTAYAGCLQTIRKSNPPLGAAYRVRKEGLTGTAPLPKSRP